MSALKDRLQESQKEAMKSRDKERLGTLRLILAAMKQKEVDERIELSDEQIIAILDKMIKQRRESISQYEAGNRPDLAEKEAAEIKVIQAYMPSALSEAEIDTLVTEAIAQVGAASIKDMGKLMGVLTPKVKGRADMTVVSAKVKAKLGA
jgi:uncharacterized protein YqeY